MLHGRARWQIGTADEEQAIALAKEAGVSPLVAKLLIQRGIHTGDEAKRFLYEGIDGFHDPFLLDGMQEAAQRIRLAINRKELIRVYGDYDADGVTSTSLMVWLLRGLGARFDYYIPHRVREGYGLNREAIQLAHEDGVALIVTVDTGVSAVEEVALIRELGMDVVITDHHEPPAVLPEALALINPKKPGCPYPYKGLAGVGVALKLAQALIGRVPEELLEYAAIGTVADLMPLTDENRVIVRLGLDRLRTTAAVGLQALLSVSGVEQREVSAGHIGFGLAPRLNASGRLESAEIAVQLLTSEDPDEAAELAQTLDALNIERQQIVEEITKLAVDQVEAMRHSETGEAEDAQTMAQQPYISAAEVAAAAEADMSTGQLPHVLVLAGDRWNIGVVGIVASRIVERYYRPTLVLSIDPETGLAKGSARSIAGFDMYQALTKCADLLDHYGGHALAAGMTLSSANLIQFSQRLNSLASDQLTAEDLVPLLKADAVARLADVTLDSLDELMLLAPYGMGNPTPKFVFESLELTELRTMGRENQHLKLLLGQEQEETSQKIEGVAFGQGKLGSWMTTGATVEVMAELSVNEWNGIRKPQLLIRDLRIPHVQLFDWRGSTRTQEKLAILGAAAENAESDIHIVPGVVLFAYDNRDSKALAAAAAEAENCGLPAWQFIASSAQVVPMNAQGELCAFHSVTDVVFYNLPRTISDLVQAIQHCSAMQRCYALFKETDVTRTSAVPSREQFKGVYGAIRKLGQWKVGGDHHQICRELARRLKISESAVQFMIIIFEELGFIERDETYYRTVTDPVKRDLSESAAYQASLDFAETERVCVYTSAKQLEQWIRSTKAL